MESYEVGGTGEVHSDAKPKKGCFVTRQSAVLITIVVIFFFFLVAVLFYFLPLYSTLPDEECTPAPEEDLDPLPPIPADPVPTEDPRGPYEGRLPDTLLPEHYNVWIKTYLDDEDGDKKFTFDGSVDIHLRCAEDTNIIKVHFLRLNIDYQSIKVTHLQTNNNQIDQTIRDIYTEEIYDFLVIELEEVLLTGELYSLSIDYNATLPNQPYFGYYRCKYDVGGETRWISGAVFEPHGARMTFPCLDEPHLKATFDIVLVHRPKRRALATMNEVAFESDGEWNTTYFNRSVIMPTYTLSISLTDFASLEMTTPNDILFRVWASEEDIMAANYSLYIGSALLTYFEDYFNQSYTIPKMDMLAFPEFASGALECWGHVMYQDSAMLYDPEADPPTQEKRVASIVAHEISHMWFGNSITPEWWDHLWLNEGFATFIPYIGLERFYPEWKIWDQFLTDDLAPAFSVDSTYQSKPLIRTTEWVDEIFSMFDTISYSKGGSVLRSLNTFLRNDTISEGIKRYLQEHEYGSVVTDDLWDALAKADENDQNTDVKQIMDTWTLQSGYPVVTVIRTGVDTVEINQTHFLLDPNDEPTDEYPNQGYKWYVPLTYTHQSDINYYSPSYDMLSPEEDTKKVHLEGAKEDDWVLFNIDQRGYFRVNYDNDNWEKLSEQLKADHKVFPTQTRASLLDDSLTISQPGYVDHVYGLKLTEYMYYEEEYAPWELVLDAIPFTHGMLLRTSEFGLFQKYWRNQILPLYLTLGWNFTNSDLLDYYQRINAIETSCLYGNEDCISVARSLYQAWMENPDVDPIPPEVDEIIYCTAIRYGGSAEWQFAYDQSKSSDSSKRSLLESAMGCSRDDWQLQSYLEDYHTDDNSRVAINNIREKSSLGFATAWEFTMTNFEELQQIYGDSAFDIVWDFADLMTTKYDLDKINMFGMKYNDMPESAASGFYRTIEIVETNIAWMNRNQNSIRDWLGDVTKDIADMTMRAHSVDDMLIENIKSTVTKRRAPVRDLPKKKPFWNFARNSE